MDAFDGNSDVEESQATQMLQELMQGRASSVLSPSQPPKSTPTSLALAPDAASNSYTSSRHSTSLPTYHFHGLATTQTQTQSITEDPQAEEGSQKENIQAGQLPTSSDARQTPLTASNHPSSSKTPAKAINEEQSSLAHSKTKTPNPRPVAIRALDFPRGRFMEPTSKAEKSANTKTPSTLPSRQSKHKASPFRSRESSQDSVRSSSRDPEEKHIAPYKRLAPPLPGLGRAKLSADDEVNPLNPNRASMLSLPNRRGPVISSHQGNVLVESTPSNSSQSQSQSQPSQSLIQDTQIIERHYGSPPQWHSNNDGYESNESFGRSLLAGGDTRPSTQEPEPSSELQQTQPVDDVEMQGPLAAWTATTGQTGGATAGSNPQSNPRSLVNFFKPTNHWRYANYNVPEELGQNVNNSPARAGQQPASSTWEETQPTTEEDYQRPPRRNFPPARSTKVTQGSASPVPASPNREDLEIVPDSEPLHPSPRRPQPIDETDSDDEDVPMPPRKTVRLAEEEEEDDDDQPGFKPLVIIQRPENENGEGQDSDEDDIPLAVKSAQGRKGQGIAKSKKAAGKLKATSETPAELVPPSEKKKRGRKPGSKAKVAETAPPRTRAGRSWETAFVPSSVPEQDMPPRTANKGKKAIAAKPRSTRATASKTVNYQESSSEEDEPAPVDDLGDLSPLTGAGDQTTEPDDDYMDIDPAEPGPSARKRKRGAPTSAVVKQEGKKANKRKSPPAKRLRSTAISQKAENAATRVFALWKQDGHYYPGIVQSILDNMHYFIKFDDQTEATVTIDQMRLGVLHPGDDVLIGSHSLGCKVVKFNKSAAKVTIKVDGKSVETDLKDIRIANKTVTFTWGDRMLGRQAIVPLFRPTPVKLSDSPSRMSMIGLPHPRGNTKKKILAKTGMVVTFSTGKKDPVQDKSALTNALKSTGGSVVENMISLFHMEGRFDEGGNRWTISKGDVKWTEKGIERLFLLADDANQKPKFLMALALGIPCLSTSWVHDCVKEGKEKDWLAYMLPQGFSEKLNVRLSQQVDVDWGNSVQQLEHIMDNTVPKKLFANASVLCIGYDMMPAPDKQTQPGNETNAQGAINALGRIILCMGAETVEAVSQPALASAPFTDYTYIVTRNLDHEWAYLPQSNLVDWAWVKNCLLASRLVDMPYGDVDPLMDHSQEA